MERGNIENVEDSELDSFRNLSTEYSEDNIALSRLTSSELLIESTGDLIVKWQDSELERFSNSKSLSNIYSDTEDLSAYDLPND